jgi:hypothetical protein
VVSCRSAAPGLASSPRAQLRGRHRRASRRDFLT